MTIQKPDKVELFENFVNGRSGKENTKLFNYWIQKDSAFAEKVEQYRMVFSGLKMLRIKEIEKQLNATQLGELEDDEDRLNSQELKELELIERYFKNQLNQKEKKELEYRINTEPAFAEKVEQFNFIFSGLRESRLQELESKIQEVVRPQNKEQRTLKVAKGKTETATTPKRSIIRKLLPLIAVAAALVIYFGLSLIQTSDADFYAGLQNTYQEQPKIDKLMSGNPNETTLINKGKNAISENKFKEAISVFEQLPDNKEAKLLLGHAYFGEKNFDQAEKTYRAVLQEANDPELADDADWFVAQCYLRDLPAKKKELSVVLKKIMETKGPHKHKRPAQQLYKELLSRK